MMHWTGHTSLLWYFCPKYQTNLNLRDVLQKNWPVIFKNVNVITDEDKKNWGSKCLWIHLYEEAKLDGRSTVPLKGQEDIFHCMGAESQWDHPIPASETSHWLFSLFGILFFRHLHTVPCPMFDLHCSVKSSLDTSSNTLPSLRHFLFCLSAVFFPVVFTTIKHTIVLIYLICCLSSLE